jgi:CRP/FNR family transcriptional regulator, dissimilatory nitrate respiration regulator
LKPADALPIIEPMCKACSVDLASALECPERIPEYLRQLYLFRGLDEDRLAAVTSNLRTLHLDDGQWLYREGDPAERFYVLREGQIALFRQSPEGRESVIAIVGGDEVFGEELLIEEQARHDVHAKAVGACTLHSIDRRAFRPLLGDSVELCHRVMTTLHRRQRMLLDHIERLTLHDATRRLIAYLLERAGDESGPRRLRLSIPKSTLASHLAIQPETLSRIFTRLKDCRYLREDGDDLVLLAPEDLRSGVGCSQCHLRYWGCPGPAGEWHGAGSPADPSAVHLRGTH